MTRSPRSLLALALALGTGCGSSSGRPEGVAKAGGQKAAETACIRLLPGPLGDGADWEIDSAWHARPLDADRPETGLEPALRSDFDGASDPAAAGWLVHEAFASFVRPDAKAAPAPVVRDGALEFARRESVAARIVAVAPLTPCVLSLRVRQPESAAEEIRLVAVDLNDDVSSLADPLEIAKRIRDGERPVVTAQRELRRSPADGSDPQRPGVRARDAQGFETWRFEFSTQWTARALLLIAFGSEVGGEPVAIDDVTLHVLPARALLGLPPGRLSSFDLPRPWESLDPKLRATKVRCDWENRRALLLPRGARARCRFAPGRDGSEGALEIGFALVREERWIARGPHREVVHVRVGSRQQDVVVELVPGMPSCWKDLTIPLEGALGAGPFELEIVVEGQDSPDGPLVAVSDPIVYSPSPSAAPDPAAPFNLLLISLDTMRADRLGKRVRGRSLTPNLDALAAQSIVASHALANSSYTLPAHVSMLTSQRPGEHGLLSYLDVFSAARSPNLAQIAAKHGYVTAAFTSGGMLNAEFCGIDLGFDRFGEIDSMLSPDDRLRRGAPLRHQQGYNLELAARNRLDRSVLPWLASHRGAPFVLFLHTYVVHNYQPEPGLRAEFTRDLPKTPLEITGPVPYRAFLSDEYLARVGHADERFAFEGEGEHRFVDARDLPKVEALYDATVAQADRDVGRVLAELDRLGLAERTIVVVTSDHGEEFLEHGDLSHARTLFDEILRVPLIMRVPGLAPRTLEDPVEHIDVAPTLLARMGLPVDPRMRGADLFAEDYEPREVTIHEGIEVKNAVGKDGEPMTLRAARTRGAKLILLTPFAPDLPAGSLDEARIRDQLAAIGYIGGGVPAGGFFDLRKDREEQFDLAAETLQQPLSPVHSSQMSGLAKRLLEEKFE